MEATALRSGRRRSERSEAGNDMLGRLYSAIYISGWWADSDLQEQSAGRSTACIPVLLTGRLKNCGRILRCGSRTDVLSATTCQLRSIRHTSVVSVATACWQSAGQADGDYLYAGGTGSNGSNDLIIRRWDNDGRGAPRDLYRRRQHDI